MDKIFIAHNGYHPFRIVNVYKLITPAKNRVCLFSGCITIFCRWRLMINQFTFGTTRMTVKSRFTAR